MRWVRETGLSHVVAEDGLYINCMHTTTGAASAGPGVVFSQRNVQGVPIRLLVPLTRAPKRKGRKPCLPNACDPCHAGRCDDVWSTRACWPPRSTIVYAWPPDKAESVCPRKASMEMKAAHNGRAAAAAGARARCEWLAACRSSPCARKPALLRCGAAGR